VAVAAVAAVAVKVAVAVTVAVNMWNIRITTKIKFSPEKTKTMVLIVTLNGSLAVMTWRVLRFRMEKTPSGQRSAVASTLLNNQSRTDCKRQSSKMVVWHGANHTALQ
jgi:H+/Cl- antiporter ClcA